MLPLGLDKTESEAYNINSNASGLGEIPYRWYTVHEPLCGRIDLFDTDGYSPDERQHGALHIYVVHLINPLHVLQRVFVFIPGIAKKYFKGCCL